jgi:hypothetical protein
MKVNQKLNPSNNMNAEQWKERLPLIQALLDGELQEAHYSIVNKWVTCNDTDFGRAIEQYRRNPKPREVYLVERKHPDGTTYLLPSKWDHLPPTTPCEKTVKFREVIECQPTQEGA